MALIVEGKVLGVEHVSGKGDNGDYSYMRVHVLSGLDVLRGRLADGFGPAPKEGDTVRLEVAVSAYKNKSGAPQLSYTMLRNAAAGSASGASPVRAAG